MKTDKTTKRIVYTTDARLALAKFAAVEGQPEKIATLSGYAIVWDVLSSDRGGFKVRLLPGSATFATPTHALYHHDYTHVIGSTANGTLRLYPDETGVRVEIDLPDTTSGRDVEELVEGRYVTGMSFAMIGTPDASEVTEAGQTILNVAKFDCDEVTVTAIPAFTATSIDVKEDDVPEDAAAGPSQMSAAKKMDDEANGKKERNREKRKLEELRLALYRL
jgi:HK97 family phage prohead protease